MTLKVYHILGHTQTVLSALIAVLAWIYFKHRQPEIKLIGLLFFLGFLAHIAYDVVLFLALKGFSNYTLYPYSLLSFLVMSRIYAVALQHRYNTWIILTCLIYALVWGTIPFFFNEMLVSSIIRFLEAFFIIGYAVFYFYKLLQEMPTMHLHHLPMFWFNAAFLLYFSGAAFLFAFMDYLVTVLNSDLITVMSCHNILNIIEHFIVMVGIYYEYQLIKPTVKQV